MWIHLTCVYMLQHCEPQQNKYKILSTVAQTKQLITLTSFNVIYIYMQQVNERIFFQHLN